MAKYPEIKTPRGQIIVDEENMKAELTFYTDAFEGRGGGRRGHGGAQSWTGAFHDAQWFVDNEVLRLSEPYIPLRTGMLIKSGILGTELGSGEVWYIAPYAAAQYYMTNRMTRNPTGPLRGSFWFERMKSLYKDRILEGARKITRGAKG